MNPMNLKISHSLKEIEVSHPRPCLECPAVGNQELPMKCT